MGEESKVTRVYSYECGRMIGGRVVRGIQTYLDDQGLDNDVTVTKLSLFIEGHRWKITGPPDEVDQALDDIYDFLGKFPRIDRPVHSNGISICGSFATPPGATTGHPDASCP